MQQHGWISHVLCYAKKGRLKRFYILCDSTCMAFCPCPRGRREMRGRRALHLPSMRTVLSKTLVFASQPQPGITTVLCQGSWKHHPYVTACSCHPHPDSPTSKGRLLQSHLLSTKSKPPFPQCAPILPSFGRKNPSFMLLTLRFEWP